MVRALGFVVLAGCSRVETVYDVGTACFDRSSYDEPPWPPPAVFTTPSRFAVGDPLVADIWLSYTAQPHWIAFSCSLERVGSEIALASSYTYERPGPRSMVSWSQGYLHAGCELDDPLEEGTYTVTYGTASFTLDVPTDGVDACLCSDNADPSCLLDPDP
jgi:hypothetical protein